MIKNYVLKERAKTPGIDFNAKTGERLMTGIFMAMDGVFFFKPAMEWLRQYVKEPAPKTELYLYAKAINSSSAKALYHFLRLLISMEDASNRLTIIWYYKDEEDIEIGKEYEERLGFTFRFDEKGNA